jgi:alpha-glucosidase
LRGTPTMYYGDEIGMTDVSIAPEDAQDPAERNQPGIGLGRDPQRTPMRWDASPLGGFTTAAPWLPLGDRTDANVVTQMADRRSLLSLYRQLLALRRESAPLTLGTLEAVAAVGDVLRYERSDGRSRLVILLNLGSREQRQPVSPARLLLSTRPERAGELIDAVLELGAAEGVILEVLPKRNNQDGLDVR